MDGGLILLIVLGVFGLVFLGLLFDSFFTVEQGSVGVVERFGKFNRISQPGLNLKLPLIESVEKVDTRVQQLDVKVETKTKDNVFIISKVSVQFYVVDAYKAMYKLKDAGAQISSYVFDVVRAQVPLLALDEVFEKKDDVANAVKSELDDSMDEFGFQIVKALVTDIDPDAKVKEAMNEINAATRHRMAATEKAEAEKILLVKNAEAESESKKLQGKGIADQRKAIIDGLRESVEIFQSAIPGSSAADVMTLILTTQYFDTLKDLGANGTNTILLPHQPGAIGDIQSQLISAMQAGNATGKSVADLNGAHLS